ncbi:hypothetical protein LZ31DRAFT_31618 [Colletotrichum somersetense]|nr:hypothetical protein LZ31DRAFT_31618 [Colletotrichum somersetense]
MTQRVGETNGEYSRRWTCPKCVSACRGGRKGSWSPMYQRRPDGYFWGRDFRMSVVCNVPGVATDCPCLYDTSCSWVPVRGKWNVEAATTVGECPQFFFVIPGDAGAMRGDPFRASLSRKRSLVRQIFRETPVLGVDENVRSFRDAARTGREPVGAPTARTQRGPTAATHGTGQVSLCLLGHDIAKCCFPS